MNKISQMSASNRAHSRIATFTEKVKLAFERIPKGDPSRSVIAALVGKKGRSALLLASDMEARRELQEQIVKLVLEKHRNEPDLTFYHLTLIDDAGNTSDRWPVVDINALRRKADRALRSLGLSGVNVIEAHPLINFPQEGEGRMILVHVHALAWSKEPIDLKKARVELGRKGGWKTSLGAAPAVIEEIGPTSEDLEAVALYITKPPHCGKNRVPHPDKEGEFRLRDTLKGYRPEFALRMFELLSQFELLDLIFSVGDGKSIRQPLRSGMNAWHKRRPRSVRDLPGEFDTWRFWVELREGFGSKNYKPIRILSGGARMRPVKALAPSAKRRRKKIVVPPMLIRARRRARAKAAKRMP